jgi:hypothetical protein
MTTQDNVVRIDYETPYGPAHLQWRRCSKHTSGPEQQTCDGQHDIAIAKAMRKAMTSLRKMGTLA